jgi:hypothetical protein
MDKIKYFKISFSQVQQRNVWDLETYQRNYAQSIIIEDMKDQKYIVIGCDVDELPTIDFMEKIKSHYEYLHSCKKIPMNLYYYNFENKLNSCWTAPFVINDYGFRQARSLQSLRMAHSPSFSTQVCGNHLSYFMTIPEIQRKISHFSHTEYNTSEYNTIDKIRDNIKNKVDLYRRGNIKITSPTEQDKALFPKGWEEYQANLVNV